MLRYLFVGLLILLPAGTAVAVAQTFELEVSHVHLLKDRYGRLAITEQGISYRPEGTGREAKEAREWAFGDLAQIRIPAPDILELTTYEDQKRQLGRDKTFRFRIIRGAVTPEMVAFLIRRSPRPIASSVFPGVPGEPTFSIPVKRTRRLAGSNGLLKIYPDVVIYESLDDPSDSRWWRYSDIQSFGHPTRFRLSLTTYELGFWSSDRVFDFQLKADLPTGSSDYLWDRLNPIALPGGATGK